MASASRLTVLFSTCSASAVPLLVAIVVSLFVSMASMRQPSEGRKSPTKMAPFCGFTHKKKTLEEEEDKRIIHSLLCDLHENGHIWRNKKTAFYGFIKCGNSALNWRMGLLFFWVFSFSVFEVPFGQTMESALLAGIKVA